MMSSALRAARLLVLASSLLACSARNDAPAPPELAAAELAEPTYVPSYTEAGEELLLEERSDGARMTGHVLAAHSDTDEEPTWVIHTELNGQPVEASLEGARVHDAAFLGHGMVSIGEDHVLRAHVDGEVVELDAEALGPLSVAGNVVAYVRGAMPFYELARADVERGVAGAVTTDMAPVWSPAVSPDGQQIVFVSGVSGMPRLYRVQGEGAAELLPPTDSFPSSLGAPRFDGTTLEFEDEMGQHHALLITASIPGSAGALAP